jgi:hypothetical protein
MTKAVTMGREGDSSWKYVNLGTLTATATNGLSASKSVQSKVG